MYCMCREGVGVIAIDGCFKYVCICKLFIINVSADRMNEWMNINKEVVISSTKKFFELI